MKWPPLQSQNVYRFAELRFSILHRLTYNTLCHSNAHFIYKFLYFKEFVIGLFIRKEPSQQSYLSKFFFFCHTHQCRATKMRSVIFFSMFFLICWGKNRTLLSIMFSVHVFFHAQIVCIMVNIFCFHPRKTGIIWIFS